MKYIVNFTLSYVCMYFVCTKVTIEWSVIQLNLFIGGLNNFNMLISRVREEGVEVTKNDWHLKTFTKYVYQFDLT